MTAPIQPSRHFHWISRTDGNPATLADLNDPMSQFYSSAIGDDLYRSIFAALDSMTSGTDSIRDRMPRHICDTRPATRLEIGFGNGRVYRQLRSYEFAGDYTGIEHSVADPAILTYPDVHAADVDAIYIGSKEEVRDWATAAGYTACFPAGIEADAELSAFIEITK